MPIHDQWLRKCSLFVLKGTNPDIADTKGLDLSNLRIRFRTFAGDNSAHRPPWASIRITNLKPDTESSLVSEYNSVVLQAGYQSGKFGTIFKGQIKEYRRGHESTTDTFLNIEAGDGDYAYNNTWVNTTLAKGATDEDLKKTATDALAKNGLQVKFNDEAQTAAGRGHGTFRGVVQDGMAHAELTAATRIAAQTWTIVDGKIQIVNLNGYVPGEIIKLSSTTGMVWWPEQTQEGIEVTTLLNPAIRVGNLVQIDNRDINKTQAPGGAFQVRPIPGEVADIQYWSPVTNDGYYLVITIEHHGDTRGNEWHTKMLCMAADVSAAAGGASQQPDQGAVPTTTPVPAPAGDQLPKGDDPIPGSNFNDAGSPPSFGDT